MSNILNDHEVQWMYLIYMYLFIIIFFFKEFDLSYHFQRNSESDAHAHILAEYIFDSTASNARIVTHQDISDFYKSVFEYDDYMADQISRRYIEWGDVNGDGALTKEGKYNNLTIFPHYQADF